MEQTRCELLIKQIDTLLSKSANASLKELDVTFSQVSALRAIESCPGHEAAFKQVERMLKVSQPTTAGLISRLRDKGLVETYDSSTSTNAKVVRLTEKGRQVCEDAEVAMSSEDERILAGFSDEERETFTAMLKRVVDNLGG